MVIWYSVVSVCGSNDVMVIGCSAVWDKYLPMTHSPTFSLPPPLQIMPVNIIPHLLKEPKFPAEFIPEYTRLLER